MIERYIVLIALQRRARESKSEKLIALGENRKALSLVHVYTFSLDCVSSRSSFVRFVILPAVRGYYKFEARERDNCTHLSKTARVTRTSARYVLNYDGNYTGVEKNSLSPS